MSDAGAWNFKGVNFQAKVALCLFLENLADDKFQSIILEDPNWEDFTLQFLDKIVVCECKNLSRSLGHATVRAILQNVHNRGIEMGKGSEILLCANKITPSLKSDIEKAWNPLLHDSIVEKLISKKNFQRDIAELIKFVKPREFHSVDLDKMGLDLLNHRLPFFLPDNKLQLILDSQVIQNIYLKSERQQAFTTSDFQNQIEVLRNDCIVNNGTFDPLQRQAIEIVSDLKLALKGTRPFLLTGDHLSSITAQPLLAFYLLDELEKLSIMEMNRSSELINALAKPRYFYRLINLLEKHLENNVDFVFDFFITRYDDFGSAPDTYIRSHVLDIIKKSLLMDPELQDKVTTFVKHICVNYSSEFKNRFANSDQEKRVIGEILLELMKCEIDIEEIVSIASLSFDITEGGFGLLMDTPPEIYQILKRYIEEDFDGNFEKVVQLVIAQYDEQYKEKFEGWEWGGAGTSRSGNHYSLSDRHFVALVLKPALDAYYKQTQNFEFIKSRCVSKTEDVSRERPDFLNRAALEIILERYQSPDVQVSDEAFEILSEFIDSKHGCPHKADLIYQEIQGGSMPDDNVWRLAVIHASKYNKPTSPFLDRIVTRLASAGHTQAKTILSKWQKNPEYYDRFTSSASVSTIVNEQLETNFEGAVELFTDFISQEHFVNDTFDSFDVYDLARGLINILNKNFDIGVRILWNLVGSDSLGKNQQLLLGYTLSGIDQKTANEETILNLFNAFVMPFLIDRGKESSIEVYLTESIAREHIVQFAETLAELGHVRSTLTVIDLFIGDSDPKMPTGDKKEDEFNEHARMLRGECNLSITSVRGWCGWTLMKCTTLHGRDWIGDIIEKTERLLIDENYYVQHMASFALAQLARIRLTHIKDTKELFLDTDRREALMKAQEIERIAFDFLDRVSAYPDSARESMAKSIINTFANIRTLDKMHALRLLVTLKDSFSPESLEDAIPLFIFYAEFRSDAYKDWEWKEDGLYHDLESFNDKPFKDLLISMIDTGNVEMLKILAFKLAVLPDEGTGDDNLFEISLGYLQRFVDPDKYDDEIFRSIYVYFVDRQIEKHFDACYDLWRNCIEIERAVLLGNFEEKKPQSIPNWLEGTHKDVLLMVKEKLGDERFLTDLELFIDFPKGVSLWSVGSAISLLKEAIILEDNLNYNEPPDWFFSVRHHLGAVLINTGKFREAEKIYLQDLQV